MTSEDKMVKDTVTAEKQKADNAEIDASFDPKEKGEAVGEKLRRIRLEKRLDIRDIAAYLCIRVRFLEDIEEGNLRELPGDTYASGFIRSYAAYLGVDPNEMDTRLRVEMAEQKVAAERAEAQLIEPDLETASPNNKVIFAAVLLLALFYAGWEIYTRATTEDNVVYVGQEQTFEPQNPNPVVDNVTTTDAFYVEPEKVSEKPVEKFVTMKPAEVTETTVAVVDSPWAKLPETADDAVVVEETQVVIEKTPVEVKKPDVPRLFGAKNVNARVVLAAKEETWIEVTQENADGGVDVIISRLLYEGDKYRLPNEPDLFLRTGNAGGLKVLVDGREIPALGRSGSTKTHVPMNADELLKNIND